MPDSWTQHTIAELCEMVKGSAPISKTKEGPFPLVTTGAERKTADYYQFDAAAVCVPMISSTGHGHASLKRVHYQEGKFALANLLTALIVRDQTRLSPRFLHLYLNFYKDQLLVPLQAGAANMTITIGRLATVPIRFPSLVQQERILQTLDEADEIRRLRAHADGRTAVLVPAIFHEKFGDPEHTTLPVKPLISLIRDDRPITYGILKPGDNIPDGVPYVRVLDIKQGRLNINDLHKTTNEIAQQYRRSTLQAGDILLTIRGTVGRTCIVPNNLQGANITQDTARLAPTDEVDVLYLTEFLNTPWAQSWMTHHMVGQAVKGINLGDVKKIPVPLPPLSMQQQFAARVAEVRKLEESQAASRNKLNDLSQTLLHHAFRGEL